MKRVRAIKLFVLVCALAGVAQTFTAEMIYSYDELLRQEAIFAAQMAEMRKKEAMVLINEARQKASQGIMSSAEAITIIEEQNAFIAEIDNALKSKMGQVVEDVKAADRVQENYVRSFMSVAKNLGSRALAPFKAGYGYTQEQKETALKVIDGLVEKRKQLTKDYQKAIKAKLTPVERDILKERYETIIADLNDEMYQQQLITGDVMSMQRKLFWAAIAAGAAVAGIYLLTPGTEINPIVVDKIETALSEKLNGVEAIAEKQEMPSGVPAQVELNKPSLAKAVTLGESLGQSGSSQFGQETNGVQDVSDVIALNEDYNQMSTQTEETIVENKEPEALEDESGETKVESPEQPSVLMNQSFESMSNDEKEKLAEELLNRYSRTPDEISFLEDYSADLHNQAFASRPATDKEWEKEYDRLRSIRVIVGSEEQAALKARLKPYEEEAADADDKLWKSRQLSAVVDNDRRGEMGTWRDIKIGLSESNEAASLRKRLEGHIEYEIQQAIVENDNKKVEHMKAFRDNMSSMFSYSQEGEGELQRLEKVREKFIQDLKAFQEKRNLPSVEPIVSTDQTPSINSTPVDEPDVKIEEVVTPVKEQQGIISTEGDAGVIDDQAGSQVQDKEAELAKLRDGFYEAYDDHSLALKALLKKADESDDPLMRDVLYNEIAKKRDLLSYNFNTGSFLNRLERSDNSQKAYDQLVQEWAYNTSQIQQLENSIEDINKEKQLLFDDYSKLAEEVYKGYEGFQEVTPSIAMNEFKESTNFSLGSDITNGTSQDDILASLREQREAIQRELQAIAAQQKIADTEAGVVDTERLANTTGVDGQTEEQQD